MSLRPVTVLIVEDDCLTGLGYRIGLEEAGHSVLALARTGEQAMRLAGLYRPSHVIIDLRLKGPMDGIDVAHELERLYPCHVIFATGVADRRTLELLASLKSIAILVKPLRFNAFSRLFGNPAPA